MSELEDRVQVLEEIVAGLHNITIPEPKYKKIIDLSRIVGSDIDMEFCDDDFIDAIGPLKAIDSSHVFKYISKNMNTSWRKCRIRQDHWHCWQGGKCPLPDGLAVDILLRRGSIIRSTTTYNTLDWVREHPTSDWDIIAFKVLGVTDGWRYEWEKE